MRKGICVLASRVALAIGLSVPAYPEASRVRCSAMTIRLRLPRSHQPAGRGLADQGRHQLRPKALRLVPGQPDKILLRGASRKRSTSNRTGRSRTRATAAPTRDIGPLANTAEQHQAVACPGNQIPLLQGPGKPLSVHERKSRSPATLAV